jgi:hypothetical protein
MLWQIISLFMVATQEYSSFNVLCLMIFEDAYPQFKEVQRGILSTYKSGRMAGMVCGCYYLAFRAFADVCTGDFAENPASECA